MVRLSALRNMPVIQGKQRLGLLQSVSLDEARKRVRALIVSCGIRGKRVVPRESVLSIGDGFILSGDSRRYHRSDEGSSCPFIRDSSGLLVGYVTDYAIDEATLSVVAAEMKPGHQPRLERLWMFSYARQDADALELTIPVCMGSELIGVREGMESCEYPP